MMKRYLFLLVIIAYASCSAVRISSDLPEIKKWEADIQKFEALDKSETYPDNSILFTGSSSIRRWNTLAEDMAPYPVIQRGYGGAKLSDFAVYAERIIHPHPCSAIVLFVANDITGNENDKTPREVLALFRQIVTTIRNKFPDTPVFWIAITPTPSRWDAWPRINEANKLIHEYCVRQQNLFFISTSNAFLNEEGIPKSELFVTDNLHLSTEGYRVWKGIIKNELYKVLLK